MKVKIGLCIAAAVGMLLGCNTGVSAEGVSSDFEDPVGVSEEEAEDSLYVSEEGYRIDGDGYYSVASWCQNGDDFIFGRMYYPEDFDDSEQYTTVVLIHGASLTADFWDRIYAPELAKAGYICYAFDERSGATGGRGSYSTPTEDGESTVADAAKDAEAALDFVESKSYVNQDQIFLFGNSKGSMTAQVVASRRNDEIAGMVCLYGSITEENKDRLEDYEEIAENPYSNNEVLFIQGSGDTMMTVDGTIENIGWYTDSSFVLISDAYHGFGNQNDRPANICIESVIDYIDRLINRSGELENISASTSDDRLVSDEGYTITGDGYYCTITWCENDGQQIFGRMYYPEDFDENEEYTAVILAHGNSGTADSSDKFFGPGLAQNGYIAYAIDYRSSTEAGRGSYSDPTEDGVATVETYASDVGAALDFLQSRDFVNADHIYLAGTSMGGLAVQLTASQRSDEVAGMIIYSGALSEDNASLTESYDEIAGNPYDGGEVLFVQGLDDDTCLWERSVSNMEWYEHSTAAIISSTGHGYGYENNRSSQIALDNTLEFLYRTSNNIGEEE